MTRKYSIDILRIISALAVIIIHVVSAPVANAIGTVPASLEQSLHLIHILMKWSVPVFFMITGYCVLSKKECSYKYSFSHVGKYIGVLFTVGLFYALLEQVFAFRTFNLDILKISLFNVISGNLWDHMWYVYAIIGVYLVLPVLHSFFQQGEKNIYILTGLLFLFTILVPTVQGILPVGIDFPFGGYLFYVCFGGLVAKCHISKNVYGCSVICAVISVVYIILTHVTRDFGYNSLAVAVIAMSVFLLVSKLDIKPNEIILKVSACTWGIYLLHPFFINIILKLFKIDLLTTLPYLKLVVFLIVIAVMSYVATYILRKIPFIKKLF